MINLKRILVAVDFSEHSRIALRYGAELAESFDAELIACHVMEPLHHFSQVPPIGDGVMPARIPELQVSDVRTLAEKWLDESNVSGSRILIKPGHPFAEIVRQARDEDVDLIVIGTHGHGAVAHMLLGSVAERVVRKAPCPVLVVREGEHDFVKP